MLKLVFVNTFLKKKKLSTRSLKRSFGIYRMKSSLLLCSLLILVNNTLLARDVTITKDGISFFEFIKYSNFKTYHNIDVNLIEEVHYTLKGHQYRGGSSIQYLLPSIEHCSFFSNESLCSSLGDNLGLNLLPSFVSKSGTFNPVDDKSNCFGASFNYHSAEHFYVSYLPSLGISRIIKRAFRKLKDTDKLKSGDVFLIRDIEQEELIQHSAVYIGKDLFFHKPSYHQSSPWIIQDFDQLILPYRNEYNKIEVYRKRDSTPLKLIESDIFGS